MVNRMTHDLDKEIIVEGFTILYSKNITTSKTLDEILKSLQKHARYFTPFKVDRNKALVVYRDTCSETGLTEVSVVANNNTITIVSPSPWAIDYVHTIIEGDAERIESMEDENEQISDYLDSYNYDRFDDVCKDRLVMAFPETWEVGVSKDMIIDNLKKQGALKVDKGYNEEIGEYDEVWLAIEHNNLPRLIHISIQEMPDLTTGIASLITLTALSPEALREALNALGFYYDPDYL